MTDAAEPLELLTVGVNQAARLVAATRPEQLDRPTPCTDWDVQTLLQHMVGGLERFRDTVMGRKADWGGAPEAVASGDWAAPYREAADGLLDAWHGAGALERSYPFMGMEAPAAMLINFQLVEVALHSWDLARATGQSEQLDDRVATAALTTFQGILKPEMRGTAFAPEQSAGADAGAYARLAAFSGRAFDGSGG